MKLNLDALSFDELTPASAPRQAVFDHFGGIAKLADEPYGMAGCKLAPNIAIARTYVAGAFRIAVRLGGLWREFPQTVPRDSLLIKQLADAGQLVEYGESPAQRQKRERQEAEERERAKAAEAEAKEREQLRIGIRERLEQKRRQAREAIRARM